MYASDFIEVICALHLGRLVDAPFQGYGGLMVVGPPGVLKTTFVAVLDQHYQDALMLSDINTRQLVKYRDQIAQGRIRTLVVPELAKLYERKSETAANLEGTLRALADEGFAAASFEDSRINRLKARCMVIGALTPSLVSMHFERWEASGFNRRFLWSTIALRDPDILERASVNWNLIDFRVEHVPLPPLISGEKIPNITTAQERQHLRVLCKRQPGGDHALQIQLLVRALAVLRWWYRERGIRRDPVGVMERFALSLGKDGALIDIEEPSRPNVTRERQIVLGSAAATLSRIGWNKRRKRKKATKNKRRRRR